MTSELRTVIETGDIEGIEIECPAPECKIKTFFPPSEFIKLTAQCPHCNQPWFDKSTNSQDGRAIYPAIDSLRQISAHLRSLNATRTDIHAKVRLHVKTKQP